MNLIEQQIERIKKEIEESNKKLTYLTHEERAREFYRNGNLQHELRKYIALANKAGRFYYCFLCGYRFNNNRQRMKHVDDNHRVHLY